jgi:hypothetical protein
MHEQLNFDLSESRRRRDAGIQRVTEHNESWHTKCLDYLGHLSKRSYPIIPGDFLGEDIRDLLTDVIGEPRHVNAWGALIQAAVKKGYLLDTGRYTKARSVKAHARTVKIYRWGNVRQDI